MSSLPDLDLGLGAYAGFVLVLAYLVRGIAGFGSGLIAVPLLSVTMPVAAVVPVVVSLDYIASASQGLRHSHQIAWRELLAVVPFSLIGIGLGLFVLRGVSSGVLSRSLGAFVIAYAIYQILPLPPVRGSWMLAVPCGILGGLVGTMFGTGGPFYAIYLNLLGLDKSEFRATFATNYLIDGAVRLLGYALAGLLSWTTLFWVVAALPLVAVGLYAGGRVHLGLSQREFVRLVSLILVATGATLLIRG